ncbi:hypothetical protein HYV83_00720 [Candidatus Woesearchaeota archaeon]|nr:hypothetical protein [Candidatus Woesearchaeota archaeon]
MGFLGFLFGSSTKPKSTAVDWAQSRQRLVSEKSVRQVQPSEISLSPFAVIEGKVISAFSKVKQDITLVSSWLKYLRHKDLLHEQRHTKTHRELGEHKVRIERLQAEMVELKAALNEAKTAAQTGSFPNLVRTKSEPKADLKRTQFENRVVSTLRSRRKDYVLKQILELAAKETHSTSEIEQIVVGEKALCGRTAFYDYIRELKHKRMIRPSEKGSKKVVVAEKAGLEQVRFRT